MSYNFSPNQNKNADKHGGMNQALPFSNFDLAEPLLRALNEQGITTCFPIQELTLPVALSGHDVIGQAKTGTGKTFGFALPVLHQILTLADPKKAAQQLSTPAALVVVPTRELCKQVADDFRSVAKYTPLKIAEVYGGVGYENQISAIRKNAQVVIGTPGRLLDLMSKRALSLKLVKHLVLDEADEMLDLGFLPDVERLISQLSPRRQTMLFSATMPASVVALARRYMQKPTHIRAEMEQEIPAQHFIKQVVYRTHPLNKIELLARILQAPKRNLTVVFVPTKQRATQVYSDLHTRGFKVSSLHGGLNQTQREESLHKFKNGKTDVLVATDVAARGIDIDGITHVVNFTCPEDSKIYIHRIGRTGRAGASGTAVTFVDWDELPRWKMINRDINLDFADPLETYHTSPHFLADFQLDATISGSLKSPEKSGKSASSTPSARKIARRPSKSQNSQISSKSGSKKSRQRRRIYRNKTDQTGSN